jgi:tetratricopeptide (TPR) repeat protein
LALLDAISNELALAESYDHNLLVILQNADVTTQAQLNEVRESLGANLILATSVLAGARELEVFLQVLDPSSAHPLRTTKVRAPLDQQVSLPAKVVRAAAHLLNIGRFQPDDRRTETGTSSPEALAAFQAGEALMKQSDSAGTEGAIEKYKQAVDLDPRYALAYARLALAYSHLYFKHGDQSAIVLGKANAETSLALNRNLIEGHVSMAWILEDVGDRAGALREMAKALTLDPANPQTLTYQAQIYARMNRWDDAENIFKKVLMQRPNYWLAWNERGWNYYAQGKYHLALESFMAASFAAPKNAWALYNVGSLEFRLGRADDALECLRRSMAARPNDNAANTMAEVFRSQGKYAEACRPAPWQRS